MAYPIIQWTNDVTTESKGYLSFWVKSSNSETIYGNIRTWIDIVDVKGFTTRFNPSSTHYDWKPVDIKNTKPSDISFTTQPNYYRSVGAFFTNDFKDKKGKLIFNVQVWISGKKEAESPFSYTIDLTPIRYASTNGLYDSLTPTINSIVQSSNSEAKLSFKPNRDVTVQCYTVGTDGKEVKYGNAFLLEKGDTNIRSYPITLDSTSTYIFKSYVRPNAPYSSLLSSTTGRLDITYSRYALTEKNVDVKYSNSGDVADIVCSFKCNYKSIYTLSFYANVGGTTTLLHTLSALKSDNGGAYSITQPINLSSFSSRPTQIEVHIQAETDPSSMMIAAVSDKVSVNITKKFAPTLGNVVYTPFTTGKLMSSKSLTSGLKLPLLLTGTNDIGYGIKKIVVTHTYGGVQTTRDFTQSAKVYDLTSGHPRYAVSTSSSNMWTGGMVGASDINYCYVSFYGGLPAGINTIKVDIYVGIVYKGQKFSDPDIEQVKLTWTQEVVVPTTVKTAFDTSSAINSCVSVYKNNEAIPATVFIYSTSKGWVPVKEIKIKD